MIDRKVDFSCFTNDPNIAVSYGKKIDKIATTPNAWKNLDYTGRFRKSSVLEYTPERIEKILSEGSTFEQQKLSYDFFNRDGLYRRIIMYYATVLKYSGILIPISNIGQKLSNTNNQKRYFQAMRYVDKLNVEEIMTNMSIYALIFGSYYGVIQKLDKNSFCLLDLPAFYSRSRFRSVDGNDLIEFNVTYFDTIVEEDKRAEALKTYPKVVSDYYKKWKKQKVKSKWVLIPPDIGLSFSFFEDGMPMLLNVIPASIQYDESVDTERERELEEIRKIIVQKIPHLNDGQLVFEPDEALEMHRGTVAMLKGNNNLSVLTTYGDVEAIVSRTTADTVSSSLERMLQNVYAQGGVSGQIFAPEGSSSLKTSIENDAALMMILGRKYARFFTYVINELFGNTNLSFKYEVLPITFYNQSDYITDTMKLATSGYSFLLPAIASGLSQSELLNVKALENDVLKLGEILIPLSSAYTQAAGDNAPAKSPEKAQEEIDPNENGRPELKDGEETEKTAQNKEAKDKNKGGSK